MAKAEAMIPKGLAGEIVMLLSDTGRELTLSQIQQCLPGYRELNELSATMVRLRKIGWVQTGMVERTAARGRRVVKAYRLAGTVRPGY